MPRKTAPSASPLAPPSDVAAHPAVRALVAQGVRTGSVSFAQINDLLADLELDPDDVEQVLEALEHRAVTVVDDASAAPHSAAPISSAPVSAPAAAPTPKPARAPQPRASRRAEDAHSDLDALLADLDALAPTDVDDVASAVAEAGDEMDDEFAPVDDALKLYLNRMGQVPRLNPDEERALARVARFGPHEAAVTAKNKLVEANLRLVVHLAHHAGTRTTLPIIDLLQEGNLGLLDAVERYGPDSPKSFGSYATWWIRRSLNRAIEDHSRAMKLSSELYAAIATMQKGQRELTQTLNRAPTREELARHTGLTVAQIEEAQRAAVQPLSLDAARAGDDDADGMGDNLADPTAADVGAGFDRQELQQELEKLLEELSPREKTVLQMRFGLGPFAGQGSSDGDDVARKLGIGRERVHELETRAVRKLRKKAKGEGLERLFE